jgi:hypothetical protein
MLEQIKQEIVSGIQKDQTTNPTAQQLQLVAMPKEKDDLLSNMNFF